MKTALYPPQSRSAVNTLACLKNAVAWLLCAVSFPLLAQDSDSLANYYNLVLPNTFPISKAYAASALRTAFPPNIVMRQSGARFLPYLPGDELLYLVDGTSVGTPGTDRVVWTSVGSHAACVAFDKQLVLPARITAGQSVVHTATWFTPFGVDPCQDSSFSQPITGRWDLRDTISFGAVERRKARDGGEFNASRMRLTRNDAPWISYFWGYKLGLIEATADWTPDGLRIAPVLSNWPDLPDARTEYALVTLPPPWIEDDVVEYVNQVNFPLQPGGQYFYAVRAEDKTLLDSIPAWQRTGKSFKSGGYVSACRFYGGKNGGPNTHFYSADDKECALLKTIPQLSYEGQTFAVNMPLPGTNADGSKPCPIDSKPLYRVYNNASASNGRYVSNHRYFTERADVAAEVAQGWLDEGHVMCVPQ